jgi:hypothetical protein
MVPATSALLSLLVLKLLDKERRSHINDFNFDEAVGLFAGLNVPPKKSYATDYSYRTIRDHQQYLAPPGRTLLISDVPNASPTASSHPQVCQC